MKCKFDAAKVASNTNRHSFASNNLEYNKLKASALSLHETNSKASNYIGFKLFQKTARCFELKIF